MSLEIISTGAIPWLAQQPTAPSPPSSLSAAKDLVGIIKDSITAIAVIVSGYWTYFKFIKDRTYRPRLDISLGGRWITVDDRKFFQARTSVKNIGTSVVELLRRGTGTFATCNPRINPNTNERR